MEFGNKMKRGGYLLLAIVLLVTVFPLTAVAGEGGMRPQAVDRIELTDFKVLNWDSATSQWKDKVPVTANADGTVFTLNDTQDVDYELLKSTDGSPHISFKANVERISVYDSINDLYSQQPYFQNGVDGGQFNYLKPMIEPYNADPNYVIVKFTLCETDMTGETGNQYGPILSTKTDFTLRLKKWEKQYQQVNDAPGWAPYGTLYGQILDNGNNRVPWVDVTGQPFHHEWVAAKNVTFPYSVKIFFGIRADTYAWLDGKLVSNPAPNTPFQPTLTFTSSKTSYTFQIAPKESWEDSKRTHWVSSYWTIKVTGQDAAVGETPASAATTGTFKDKSGNNVGVTVAAVPNKSWTGKQIKPSLTVKAGGSKLKINTDYTLSYGKNKSIGKGTVTVKGTGKYSSSFVVKFNIIPKKVSIAKLTAGKKQLRVTWKKTAAAQKIAKYKISYRVKGTTAWKTKNVSAKKTSVVLKSLKKGKTYQVTIQSYKKVGKIPYYSLGSKVKLSKKIK